jgi:hypothetical protein
MSTPDHAVDPFDPPRDWLHYHAKNAEHVARLERRLALVEERVGITAGITAPSPQEPVHAVEEPRYTHPAGVVPPHVALNLRALREWIDVALAGGDVPRP